MDEIKGKSVLVVAAHPDDEVLGCGGTILRHASEGDAVHILIMTDGAGDVRGYKQERGPRQRHEFKTEYGSLAAAPAWRNAHKAADLLSASTLQILDFPDSRFDSMDILDMVHPVEAAIDRVRPHIVYTHYPQDLSVDHRRTAEAVITACRPKLGHPVKELYFFEVASSTEWALPLTFQPQMFVEIDFMEKYKVLCEAYRSEMREWPHPRSQGAMQTLGAMRGVQCGVLAAEAFMVGRIIR